MDTEDHKAISQNLCWPVSGDGHLNFRYLTGVVWLIVRSLLTGRFVKAETLDSSIHRRKKELESISHEANHRIVERFGLEGTLEIIWFHHPCHRQGHLPLDQTAQTPSNLGLNTCRKGASTASLGNLCQCLTTLIVKNFLHYI